MKHRVLLFLLLCPCLLGFSTGCGDNTKAIVTGKVTMKSGKPFFGTITAINNESGVSDTCDIGQGGSYELRNAPLGKITFFVQPVPLPMLSLELKKQWMQGKELPFEQMTPEAFKSSIGKSLRDWVTKEDFPAVLDSQRVEGQYTGAGTSPLVQDLAGGSQTTYNIDLPLMPRTGGTGPK
jgi:hypothetical protein